MTVTGRVRNAMLTAHVTSSVGWFGSVAGFLALAIMGVTSSNPAVVRAMYLSMETIGWFVIVPFSLASLTSGLVQSLGTDWGLFRHYWIIAKLVITVLAVVVLLVHMQPVSYLATIAAQTALSSTDLHGLRIRIIADSGGALMALLIATTLSVFKPRGMTSYGRQHLYPESTAEFPGATNTRLRLYLILAIGAVVLLFAALHLSNGGSHHH